MKRFWIPLSALFVFLFCILHPSEAVSGAAAGLSLWYCTVLPTLLPCMVLSGYLISTGLMEKMPPAPFAFLIGWFCGYPMGAKTIADLYKKRSISKEYGSRLLILCCEPSPMFLTGFICTGMLRLSVFQTLPCLIAVYLPPVLCYGIVHAAKKNTKPVPPSAPFKKAEAKDGPLASFLKFEEAMMNGFAVIVKIGGYLMFFTMLSCFFRNRCPVPFLSVLVSGLLEMTSGIAFTVQSGISRTMTAALCFAFAAFGGLSGAAQTASVLKGTPFSGKTVLFWKALQASMTFLMILFIFPFLKP